MTPWRAQELKASVTEKLGAILKDRHEQLFVSLSKPYLSALDITDTTHPPLRNITPTISRGSPGRTLAELHDWLYGKPPESAVTVEPHPPRLRGVEISLCLQEAMDLARQSLLYGRDNAANYQAWYVIIDGERVSPKWLVSQMTGLSVSSFHSSEARRVLIQLGFEVQRT